MPPLEGAAINLPHDDQTASQSPVSTAALAVQESHESGIPVTTLTTGEWISWPYNL